MYYDLEDDDAYQKIMSDISEMRLLSPTMSFTSALRDAIDQNRDLIVSSVEDCRNNCQDCCGDILTIWCVMGNRYVKDECRWFSGSRCHCHECDGASLLRQFRKYALLFHAMENDDTIQRIMDAVREESPDEDDLDDTIKRVMDENSDSIFKKYYTARGKLLKMNWNDKYHKHSKWNTKSW